MKESRRPRYMWSDLFTVQSSLSLTLVVCGEFPEGRVLYADPWRTSIATAAIADDCAIVDDDVEVAEDVEAVGDNK